MQTVPVYIMHYTLLTGYWHHAQEGIAMHSPHELALLSVHTFENTKNINTEN